MLIWGISDLAMYEGTTIENLPSVISDFTDYRSSIRWDTRSVTITTTANEYDISNDATLVFPFTSDDFDDAVSALQCWADAVWCEERRKEC